MPQSNGASGRGNGTAGRGTGPSARSTADGAERLFDDHEPGLDAEPGCDLETEGDARSSLDPTPALLLDERSDPDFRAHFGRALERSREVDVALTHLRLTTLDLTAREVAGLDKLRLLLAEVSAEALDVEAHRILLHPSRARPLRRLRSLLAEGVIEVRSSPLGGWSPDFTIFSSADGPFAALLGFHWFQRPFPHRGPALASLHGPDAARRVRARFEEAWSRAHDIAPAVVGILRRPELSRASPRGRRRPAASPHTP